MIIKVWLFEHLIKNKFHNSDVTFEYYRVTKYIPDSLIIIHISNYYGDFYYSIGYSKFFNSNNLDLLESIIKNYEIDINFYVKGE